MCRTGGGSCVLPLGLRALLELADDDAVTLISPGGDVRPGELAVTGDLAEVAFERLRFDTLVLAERLVTDAGPELAGPLEAAGLPVQHA